MLCLLKYESAQIQGRSVVDDNGTWFTFANLSGNSLDWMSSAPGPEGKIQRNYEIISKVD